VNKPQLSDRQITVLQLVAQGSNNEHIAQTLNIPSDAVSRCVWIVRRKLGLPDRLAMTTLSAQQIEAYRRPAKKLTKRQKEIACFIAKGLTDEDIAKQLKITQRKLELHIENICSVLQLENCVQIAYWVIEQGWVAIAQQSKEQKKEATKPIYKSLFAALALSPSNKVIMAVSKRYRLIIERHWTPINLYYSVHVVDMAKRDIAYAVGAITGVAGLEEWIRRIEESIGVSIDINKKRWLTLEESERSKG